VGFGGRAEPIQAGVPCVRAAPRRITAEERAALFKVRCALNLDAVAVISEVPWKLAPDHTSSVAVYLVALGSGIDQPEVFLAVPRACLRFTSRAPVCGIVGLPADEFSSAGERVLTVCVSRPGHSTG